MVSSLSLLFLYSTFMYFRRPPSTFIPAAEASYQFPSLKVQDSKGDSLKGCLVIYDGQQNDTRMNLAIALTAGYVNVG